jgi:hypothetical protein
MYSSKFHLEKLLSLENIKQVIAWCSELLQAQLRGKLTRTEENMEDLLTSNVFGSIKYVPYEDGLLPLLANSQDENGDALTGINQSVLNIHYDFWPRFRELGCEECEPDLLITIQYSNGQRVLVLVESKYLSDKSSVANDKEAPKDQLAREWDNLILKANQEHAKPILLYVTADFGYPRQSIEESCKEYQEKRKKDMSVFWLSWRKLPTLFLDNRQEILNDLIEVLKYQQLTFFEGITIPEASSIKWSFEAIINWDWTLNGESSIRWQFKADKNYNWQYQTNLVEWSFKN